ncbi:aromatic-ring hydroxylase C-terminal domain-containing protein [Streptomyces sp. NPDC001193]
MYLVRPDGYIAWAGPGGDALEASAEDLRGWASRFARPAQGGV